MKKLLIILLLAIQANAYEVTFKFENKEEAKKFVIWYLDGGGEQISSFNAEDWNINSLINSDEVNEIPCLYVVREKEFYCERTTTRGNR